MIYLLCGTVLAAIMDTFHYLTKKLPGYDPNNELTNIERIVIILFWPIGLIIIVREFIKARKR